MLINTNANSRIASAARTSYLVRQIQKAARKSALGSILHNKVSFSVRGCNPMNQNSSAFLR